MTSLAAESYDLRTLLAAWEDGLHAVVELARRLTPEQWDAPTECPGWSAGDIVRHLSWVEAFIDGYGWLTVDPTPPADAAPKSEIVGMWAYLRDIIEATSQRWDLHVVRYDLSQQLSVCNTLKK